MSNPTVETSADNLDELDAYIANLNNEPSVQEGALASTESQPEVDTTEAFDALVTTGLVVVEQAVSILKDIDFEFDERAKQSVVNAARPVAK